MADLSPSSTQSSALSEPHEAPDQSSLPAPESATETSESTLSFHNDKTVTDATPAVFSDSLTTAAHLPLNPTKHAAEITLPSEPQPAEHGKESARNDAKTENNAIQQETAQPGATEASTTKTAQPESPNPNGGPNLYPDVHVTHNQTSHLVDGQQTVGQSETSADSNPAHAPSALSSSTTTEEKPEPLQEAPKPQSEPPPSSPKHNKVEEESVATPSRVGPPSLTVPLVIEPVISPPNVNPRPALDTLSYLDSASLISGTLESLSGLGEDGSSYGSDSEINGLSMRRTDKYGFLGGSQYSEGSDQEIGVEVARQRELKWLEMFCQWDKWVKHRFQKVKLRCRKGIPSSLRAKAWQLLSNSQDLLDANPGKFEELEREPGEAKWLDIIEKDLHRQFPFHEMFAARGGHGQQDLYRILKAYTIYRPDEGYCQAQAPVAAVLLMHMPAEQAFWCLVQICEKYLPGYYSAGLEAIQLDGEIFFAVLRRTCPMAYRHLRKFKIDPILYMTEWFMCIYSRTLPWSCVLRVWDMFFCEGVKIVFRVGLVLLKQMLGTVEKLREVQGMYETMERLRNMSPDSVKEDVLIQEVIVLPVTEALIEKECTIQTQKWRETKGELTHQPGHRFHGTKAIYDSKRRATAISSGGSFTFLGTQAPPPGPIRTSASLLSLPGFRKKGSFNSSTKTNTVSDPSSPPSTSTQGLFQKPPIPPGGGQRIPHVQSPLAVCQTSSPREAARASEAASTKPNSSGSKIIPNSLSPSPMIVSEQITPTIPSPTANNSPLQPESLKETPSSSASFEEKKKKSKDEKKKEKEDEKKKLKEKKEKEKLEKERLKKEKESQEKERKRSSKKKN